MKSTDIEYSIILPCLNEEKTLGICIRKIHQFFSNTGLTYEIIVADNGSTDNSALVAKNNRADVIQVSQKGYGSALRRKGLCHGFIAMSAIRSCRPWGVFYLRIILETSIVV